MADDSLSLRWQGREAAASPAPAAAATAALPPPLLQARQLAYGFEAMRLLRTDRISFAVANREYDPWFRWVGRGASELGLELGTGRPAHAQRRC